VALNLNFLSEDGINCKNDLTVYALSTCAFCRRALKFLKDNSIKFKYVYFDDLDNDTQDKLEEELEKEFNKRLSFPFLVINCKKAIVGFDREEWERELL